MRFLFAKKEDMGMNETNRNTIKIRFPEEIRQWLFEKSDREGRRVSDIVREIVYEAMKNE